MPTQTIPTYDGATAVVAAVDKLEGDGHAITSVVTVGDQTLIVYETRRAARQPKGKQETRG